MNKYLFISLLVVPAISLSGCIFITHKVEVGDVPQQVQDNYLPEPSGYEIEIWQTGLDVPWSIVFTDSITALVSERKGTIRLIKDGELLKDSLIKLDVFTSLESGLMGLAVHPEYPQEPYIYAMLTYRKFLSVRNKVVRLKFDGETVEEDKIILDEIPGGILHNGGRIGFGPDRMLYIATGENFRPRRSQDLKNMGGKILRLTPDGEIPDDNPFDNSPVYSYGHRNTQGIAWHPETGMMFSSEHGPSGEFGLQAKDMINIILPGRNYGWPEVIGKMGMEKFEDPVIMWEVTTPPGGMTFWNGDLYVATMLSEALVRIKMEVKYSPEQVEITDIDRWFAERGKKGRYGRLRDAAAGPDGALYVTTSNRDGRGSPGDEDDLILRIVQMPSDR